MGIQSYTLEHGHGKSLVLLGIGWTVHDVLFKIESHDLIGWRSISRWQGAIFLRVYCEIKLGLILCRAPTSRGFLSL